MNEIKHTYTYTHTHRARLLQKAKHQSLLTLNTTDHCSRQNTWKGGTERVRKTWQTHPSVAGSVLRAYTPHTNNTHSTWHHTFNSPYWTYAHLHLSSQSKVVVGWIVPITTVKWTTCNRCNAKDVQWIGYEYTLCTPAYPSPYSLLTTSKINHWTVQRSTAVNWHFNS